MSKTLYVYDAEILSVYDGDTATAMIDLGLDVRVKTALRLYGLNTPELKTGSQKEAGEAARVFLTSLVLGKKVRVQSLEREKYGRLLVKVWLLDDKGVPVEPTVNDQILAAGHAVPFMVKG